MRLVRITGVPESETVPRHLWETGSLLIYREYRGTESQQDTLKDGQPAGGWYMDFVDVGVKYDGHWYDLDGNTEWVGAVAGGDDT